MSNIEPPIAEILPKYGLDPLFFKAERTGSGHINATYRLSPDKQGKSFILQRINDKVFVKPGIIESNLREASLYLKKHCPDQVFIAPLPTLLGDGMLFDSNGHPWRLFPYVENTHTIDQAENLDQAFDAAAEFGKLGRSLRGCDLSRFCPTIDRFHDLVSRFKQFEDAEVKASRAKAGEATFEIEQAKKYSSLVDRYSKLIGEKVLTEGIFHNDTKINNVLFDSVTHKTVAVIDLDTLMPGYFIYDLGDLLRTLVSPVNEEEKDMTKVVFRTNFYDAVVEGYLSEMGSGLSAEEKKHVSFSGPMMTYIMALRFLADHLRGNTYYHTTYPEQNLVRARNQLKLLKLMLEEKGA